MALTLLTLLWSSTLLASLAFLLGPGPRRLLDPASAGGDRGAHELLLPFDLEKRGSLELVSGVGPEGSGAWDRLWIADDQVECGSAR